jgi:CBS domain-containing protein
MNGFLSRLFTLIATTFTPALALAADFPLQTPILRQSLYVLVVFVILVGTFVFLSKGGERKTASLTKMLGDSNRPVQSVTPDTSVAESVRRMEVSKIGSILVMQDDKLVGIFTERDALNRVLARGIDPSATAVSSVMTPDPFCIAGDTTVEEAMNVFSNRKFRHLPIIDGDKVVGIISSGDLNHWLTENRTG